MNAAIPIAEFTHKVEAIVGLPVSKPWKGYGSTIFLDLGVLSEKNGAKRERGGACISIDWDWRIETNDKIVCGSSNSGPEIEAGLAMIKDLTVTGLGMVGKPQELVISFSNGWRLQSMAMISGYPQWHIRLPDNTWLSFERGTLTLGDGENPDGMSAEERSACDHAKRTAGRWGLPLKEPKAGVCRECRYFVRLDGNFYFLDYGVCTAAQSEFDGRVTKVKSGCPEFENRSI